MRPHQKGFTLVELMVVIAMLAIIAAIAIPNWVQEVQQENRNESIDNSRSAIQQMYITALSSGGASLSVNYSPSLTTYTISATASGVSSTHTIRTPGGTTLYLDAPTASSVSCFAIDGKGFPTTTSGCSIPANLTYPLSWSVSYAGQTVPISVQ
ncbi:prepilin-type N-terminal cleavage/methylation domain-containing protein [Acidithiobacillus ferrooxidans]|jgi:prepilin-type N-terminal cleavage/methylation domain-containing protein|uniref:prepilin-type N-terminal cleavage/methylation domain-containing protein n=1 Tax=Acidithiobacillus ferrooxidans TaxID=920 RepID=UPI0013D0429E|nr:prepilin-type N-terminal cleavage/methylation domain-containing protein [Acidithiobacillus ferrooxidans]MBU2857636.1 prepilin-type N-terminal cleavage/methylation domain-containing protein [Acidithiobacillus ferrooxidans]MBU2858974.1 prepilin-type N-terminal cleavage/methylation domain-containing protein [Acidithiobacillus ferrooxidans]MCR2829258.1 prepilin-type N-terminal cleavage/methylation domain-containing protein [Acidithiobacillus ferrooxidans]MDA8153419.1 prepilin-type N-terminal cle